MFAPKDPRSDDHFRLDEVAGFLAGQLSPERQAALDRHLDHCAACQAQVDGAAEAGFTMRSRPGPVDPRLQDLQERLKRRPTPDDWFVATAEEPLDMDDLLLLGPLGAGGMGTVYLYRQQRLNRDVAIKFLGFGSLDPARRERFEKEGRAVGRLNHPGIVQIYGVGHRGSVPFLVMEFCPRGDLARQIARARPAERASAALVLDLAQTMHYAHTQGIIHRDLKPANILVDAQGHYKIADFGLAKFLADESGQTRTGDILGTPAYMAPEQASGQIHEIGPATDIYALGAILYELLTGRPPFVGESPLAILKQVTETDPVPPRASRDLAAICLKCLRKTPAERYTTASDLADDLQSFLDGRPVVARSPGIVERAGKWAWRHLRNGASWLGNSWLVRPVLDLGHWLWLQRGPLLVVGLAGLVLWLSLPFLARWGARFWSPFPTLAWRETGSPYPIYADDPRDFRPSEWMPSGNLDLAHRLDSTEIPHGGARCYEARFTPAGSPWMAIGWVAEGPPLNLYEKIGARDGDAIVLRLWARSPDRITVQFGCGSDRDSVGTPAQSDWVALSPEWQEIQVNLGRSDLSGVSRAFFWKVERGRFPPGDANRMQRLFLDDIRIARVELPG
jgi:hypothetical protein